MIKAKNFYRSAFPAVLALLLCCVASAGPTYSFVKVAGEWAFYEENDGFISSLDVTPANHVQSNKAGLSDKPLLLDGKSGISLPTVGSIVNLSDKDSGNSGAYLMLMPSASNGGMRERGLLASSDSLNNRATPSESYPGGSAYLTSMANGFNNSNLSNGSFQGSLRGEPQDHTPNGNAWGYWKKDRNQNDDQDIAPVPVPVPGSIILAAVGAGLVKLLHDRRVKMSAAV